MDYHKYVFNNKKKNLLVSLMKCIKMSSQTFGFLLI